MRVDPWSTNTNDVLHRVVLVYYRDLPDGATPLAKSPSAGLMRYDGEHTAEARRRKKLGSFAARVSELLFPPPKTIPKTSG